MNREPEQEKITYGETRKGQEFLPLTQSFKN